MTTTDDAFVRVPRDLLERLVSAYDGKSALSEKMIGTPYVSDLAMEFRALLEAAPSPASTAEAKGSGPLFYAATDQENMVHTEAAIGRIGLRLTPVFASMSEANRFSDHVGGSGGVALYASPSPSPDLGWPLDEWNSLIGSHKFVQYGRYSAKHVETVQAELLRHHGQPVTDVIVALIWSLMHSRQNQKFAWDQVRKAEKEASPDRDAIIEMCAMVADELSNPKHLTGLENGTWMRAQKDAAKYLAASIRSLKSSHVTGERKP